MNRSLIVFSIVVAGTGCMTSRQGNSLDEQPEKPHNVFYRGGDGGSYQDAVVIRGAENQRRGVEAEYAFICRHHGEQNQDWKVSSQTMLKEDGKTYDMVEIELTSDNSHRYYYFDVSGNSWSEH